MGFKFDDYGSLAFVVGAIIALVAAVMNVPNATMILAIVGIIVGLLNVTKEETTMFLLAAISLAVIPAATLIAVPNAFYSGIGDVIGKVLENLVVMAAPAAILVGLKAFVQISQRK